MHGLIKTVSVQTKLYIIFESFISITNDAYFCPPCRGILALIYPDSLDRQNHCLVQLLYRNNIIYEISVHLARKSPLLQRLGNPTKISVKVFEFATVFRKSEIF